jgi:hypothetical protein
MRSPGQANVAFAMSGKSKIFLFEHIFDVSRTLWSSMKTPARLWERRLIGALLRGTTPPPSKTYGLLELADARSPLRIGGGMAISLLGVSCSFFPRSIAIGGSGERPKGVEKTKSSLCER